MLSSKSKYESLFLFSVIFNFYQFRFQSRGKSRNVYLKVLASYFSFMYLYS